MSTVTPDPNSCGTSRGVFATATRQTEFSSTETSPSPLQHVETKSHARRSRKLTRLGAPLLGPFRDRTNQLDDRTIHKRFFIR
ncbi:hypothetical protein PsorP6_009597 [Peronosclerospora sorghi]|uniref:Uncharacterized protein n=1 Tax=Peronosclerospora sorghi TaxID=230839 RepID=A0ACC0W3F1_9STRA|nr:hypothetical protein PsorP6_009597 [Peronosclerospora sorghi]